MFQIKKLLDGEREKPNLFFAYRNYINRRRIFQSILEKGIFFPPIENSSDFGRGSEVWEKYQIGQVNAAQYLSPQKITGNLRLRNSTHYNLCGQIAVIATFNENLPNGISIFATIPQGKDILNNNMTTSGYDLANFINALSPGLSITFPRNSTAINSPELFQKFSNDKFICLVNIDTGNYGRITPMKISRRAVAHWIWLREIIIDKTFGIAVKIYNPFSNFNEVYSWNTFHEAYRYTKGNTSQFLSIHIRK